MAFLVVETVNCNVYDENRLVLALVLVNAVVHHSAAAVAVCFLCYKAVRLDLLMRLMTRKTIVEHSPVIMVNQSNKLSV